MSRLKARRDEFVLHRHSFHFFWRGADGFNTVEARFPPQPGGTVPVVGRIVGVDVQIQIGDDHPRITRTTASVKAF
jgi:hypothetical protein